MNTRTSYTRAHTYSHAHVHTYTHTHTHTRTHTRTHTHTHTHTQTHTHTHRHTHTHTHTYTYTHIHTYTPARTYAFAYATLHNLARPRRYMCFVPIQRPNSLPSPCQVHQAAHYQASARSTSAAQFSYVGRIKWQHIEMVT